MKKLSLFIISHLAFLVALLLAILPFFWIKPGEINMGGDGGSLYYYDPVSFIKYNILYRIYPFGTGPVEVRNFYLPFVALLAFLKTFLVSPYLLSILHISLKLSVGFLSIYGIIQILFTQLNDKVSMEKIRYLKIEKIIAVLTGVMYIFSPLLTKEDRFINPIPSHDQIFLNPLIMYLLLKFLLTKKMLYLWSMLMITVIFAHNFSYSAAPPFFSFYPLAFLFLITYVKVILKKSIPIKGIAMGFLIFLALHSFHIIPELSNNLTSGTDINEAIFNQSDHKAYANTFYGIIGFASLPNNILLPAVSGSVWLIFAFLSPLIILVGFLKNKQILSSEKSKIRHKTFLLTGVLFLITLFFISAKVSYSSIKLYEVFFMYIPGFGMFQWFYIQWMYVYVFFYTLLLGQALFLILTSLGKAKAKFILLILFVYFIGSAWVFIKGDQFNLTHYSSKNVKRLVAMDPQYERMLKFIRSVPYDGKILQFPFSDFGFQVVSGINDGAYVGSSTIGQLTGVKDFSGYWNVAPYSEVFIKAGKEKDYKTLKQIMGLLNIRYIFYNSDPKIYDDTFPARPYEYVRQFLPATQEEYRKFIKPLIQDKVFESGPYVLYAVDEAAYLPHLYVPTQAHIYTFNQKDNKEYNEAASFISKNTVNNTRDIFIEKNVCAKNLFLTSFCDKNTLLTTPKMYFKKINPIKYVVKIKDITGPFVLVLSDQFYNDWRVFISKENIKEESGAKAYFNGDIEEGKAENIFYDKNTFESLMLKNIPDAQHIAVNGYANAWYITPKDITGKKEITFIVEMTGQRLYYYFGIISPISILGFFIWGIALVLKNGLPFYKQFPQVDKS